MRYFPLVLAVMALAGFTAYQGIITDRWRDNVEAKECAKLLDLVPKAIGSDWIGEDEEVEENIRNTAGAEGYVSRVYKNKRTEEVVRVWFIVGHSFNIWRHTPNVCYRAQGFTQRFPKEEKVVIQAEGQEPANFFTNVFSQGPGGARVFWTWSKPVSEPGQPVEWIAPEYARGHFGNMRALYKLYFTTGVKSEDEKPRDSVCVKFAQEFLPVANKILEQGKPSPAAPADVAPVAVEAPAAAAG